MDYWKLVKKLFKSDSFNVAKSIEEFDRDKHDGIIHYDCLCLRRENLEKKIRKVFRGVRINDVIKALLSQDALKLVNSKNSVQISGLQGIRFYAIWLEMLD